MSFGRVLHSLAASSRWSNRYLTIFFGLWGILLVLDSVQHALAEHVTFWAEPHIELAFRLALAAYAWLLLAVCLAPFVGLHGLTAWMAARLRSRPVRMAAHALRHTTLTIFAFLAFAFYFASWRVFSGGARFIGEEGVRFLAYNQMTLVRSAQDQSEGLMIVEIIKALVVAALFCFALPWALARVPARARSLVARAGACVLLALAVYFPIAFWAYAGRGAGEAVESGRYQLTMDSLRRFHRAEKSGPFAKLVGDGLRMLARRREAGRHVLRASELEPLIGLDAYLKGVDRSALRGYNVVLVLVESLRADRLRALGATRSVMPRVDALAERCRVFAHAYSQSTHSDYADPCSMSGAYPLRDDNHHYYDELRYPRVLVYDILKALGYRTAIFSSQDERWGNLNRFFTTGSLDVYFHAATFDGDLLVFEEDTDFVNFCKEQKTKAGNVDDPFTFDAAIRWIERVSEKPFFLYIKPQRSHFPYKIPAGFPRAFEPSEPDFSMYFGHYPRDKTELMKNAYDNSLRYVDHLLGRLVDRLEALRLADRTIIVLSGDHGQAFFEHGHAVHANLPNEEVVRVPLLVCAPGLVDPGPDERWCQHVDIAPTLLELLGLPPHPAHQGRALFGRELPRERGLYLTVQTALAHTDTIIRSSLKYTREYDTGAEWLFDLGSDPGETHNLLGARPDDAARLRAQLAAYRQKQLQYHADPAFYTNYYPPDHE